MARFAPRRWPDWAEKPTDLKRKTQQRHGKARMAQGHADSVRMLAVLNHTVDRAVPEQVWVNALPVFQARPLRSLA